MRIMGLDYGDKNIGVAISDPLLITANGIEIIRRENETSIKRSMYRIGELIKEYEVNKIVLGYPKNMDNSEGFRCEKTARFKERLERNFKKLSVILWDERLSSVAMRKHIYHLKKEKQILVIDKLSAVFILQGYLDYLSNK